ncbi:hypothetical protein B0H19DRAFT_207471 [Mycena capillaripes]|nr:hypothetical protein B0H19DRAFT_207471 [Mycena capillaripes]
MLFPKILCIVAATLGLHAASTSPNPPLLDSERPIATTALEFILASHLLRRGQTCIYWLIAIAETVCLLAQFAPSSIWAERILYTLAFGGDLTRIRLSVTPTLVLGSLLITCGAGLRLWCYHALGRHFTFETGIFKNHKLVTTGPYHMVRHPSYSGAFLAFAGMILYYGTPGSWLMECMIKTRVGMVLVIVYALIMSIVMMGLTWRISNEDEALRAEFGKAWEEWAADRCALAPGVY